MQPQDERDVFSPTRGRQNTPAKIAQARALRREMTPEEKALWTVLRGGLLDGLRFRRQQVIRGFIADFYCHAAKVVVEVDGPVHEDTGAYDAERDLVFSGYGLYVLRVTNEEVQQNMQSVLARIREAAQLLQG